MRARDVLLKLTLASVLACSWIAQAAHAQPLTPTINPTATPITVNTAPEKVAVRSKLRDQKLFNLAFGATINGGNTQTYAGNLGGRFGLIREDNQLMLEALGTLSGARREGSLTDVHWTSRSAIARARYDRFLSLSDALFIALAPRRDKQAGLDLRLQTQAGYLRNLFFFSDAHRLWTELGYDFSYDNFTPFSEEDIAKAMMEGRDLKDINKVHSARVFLGYTNRLSPTATFSAGAEGLYEVNDRKNVRVNGLSELTSSITQSFKLGVQSRVLFDNVPVAFKKKYDLIVVIQLVYAFDSAAAQATTVCPACDCTAQVQAARNQCRGEPVRQLGP